MKIRVYWKDILGQSQMAGGMALTLFSVAGVFGNLLGGRLADKYGHTKIITLGCSLLVPSLPALLWANTVYTATPLLMLGGALLLMTYGPTIVMGQSYLPNHVGFSSGMTLINKKAWKAWDCSGYRVVGSAWRYSISQITYKMLK